jgi:uncharacterized membrane protein YfcA
MQIDLIQLLVLLGAGLLAGFINTLAGGGSLLTIPALIFAGLPSTVANATNRVAVLLQTLVGSVQFRRKGKLDVSQAAVLALPALAGAILGAFIAAEIPRHIFDPILGILLLVILATLFFKPTKGDGETPARKTPLPLRVLVFFGIGVYGGFIQAGVGFLLIAAITWILGLDLVRTNALKVAVVFLFTLVALAIFAFYGQVMWLHGLVLAVGNVCGALIGVRFAIKRGTAAIRWVIAVAVVASALKLFGLLPI